MSMALIRALCCHARHGRRRCYPPPRAANQSPPLPPRANHGKAPSLVDPSQKLGVSAPLRRDLFLFSALISVPPRLRGELYSPTQKVNRSFFASIFAASTPGTFFKSSIDLKSP